MLRGEREPPQDDEDESRALYGCVTRSRSGAQTSHALPSLQGTPAFHTVARVVPPSPAVCIASLLALGRVAAFAVIVQRRASLSLVLRVPCAALTPLRRRAEVLLRILRGELSGHATVEKVVRNLRARRVLPAQLWTACPLRRNALPILSGSPHNSADRAAAAGRTIGLNVLSACNHARSRLPLTFTKSIIRMTVEFDELQARQTRLAPPTHWQRSPRWTSVPHPAHCPSPPSLPQRSSDSIACNIAVLHRRKAQAESEIEQLRQKARLRLSASRSRWLGACSVHKRDSKLRRTRRCVWVCIASHLRSRARREGQAIGRLRRRAQAEAARQCRRLQAPLAPAIPPP